jgi:hypothetical protein
MVRVQCPSCSSTISATTPPLAQWGDVRCSPCRRSGVLRWSSYAPGELLVYGFEPVVEESAAPALD